MRTLVMYAEKVWFICSWNTVLKYFGVGPGLSARDTTLMSYM